MKRVLAIDGGGIRGIIPAAFCAKVEEWHNCRIHEIFDLVAGTSTGGILALALTRPSEGDSAGSLVEFYRAHGPKIFGSPRSFRRYFRGPKHSNYYLRRALEDRFGAARLSEAITEVLIPAYDLNARRPVYFTRHSARKNDHLMREVALGTSAAPTYFEPVDFGGPLIVDGGLAANNPACAAFAHAKTLWPGEEVALFSIGTGLLTHPILAKEAKAWGLLQWAEPALECVFDGNAKATEDFFRYSGQQMYWRFQTNVNQTNAAMDGISSRALAGLVQLGERMAIQDETKINDAVENLKSVRPRSSAQIIWPREGDHVPPGNCQVIGSIQHYSGGPLYLFTGSSGHYWPSSPIIPAADGRWQGNVNLGTNPGPGTITLAIVDRQLAEYIEFYRRYAEAIHWAGIPIADLSRALTRIEVHI